MLGEIVARKREEVREARRRRSVAELQREARYAAARQGFRRAIARAPRAVIAECKRRSPSRGVLRERYDPVALARAYEAAGAAAISVLTDERYFGGSLADLAAVRAAIGLPLLRKDFIIDPYQIHEARAAGADAVLLIAAALAPADRERLLAEGRAAGLDVLVEVHTRAELEWALGAGADLIGINNRDLQTFETHLEVTEELAPLVSGDVVVVAESGLGDRQDLERLERVGVHAFLVGEALLAAPDPGAKLSKLLCA